MLGMRFVDRGALSSHVGSDTVAPADAATLRRIRLSHRLPADRAAALPPETGRFRLAALDPLSREGNRGQSGVSDSGERFG